MVYNLRLNIWWNPNGTWVILFHTENPDIVPRVNYRIKNSTRLPEETGRRTNSIWGIKAVRLFSICWVLLLFIL